MQDVGSDLVANLSLLADFYKQISELANWCRWAKAELTAANGSLATSVVPALDGTEEANHLHSVSTQWNTLHADSLVYYDLVRGYNPAIIFMFLMQTWQIADVQDQYPDLLSESRASWRAATGKDESLGNQEKATGTVEPSESAPSTIRRLAQRTSNAMRDAVRNLAWCGCFGP